MQAKAKKRRATAERWLDHLYKAPVVQDTRAQAAVHAFQKGPGDRVALAKTLDEMILEIRAQLRSAMSAINDERTALNQKSVETRDAYRDEIVEFLSAAQPGPLNDLARQVLREKSELMKKLDWNMTDLNRALMETYSQR